MKTTISLRKALADKQLLGKVLSGDTWRAWRILLTAAMGEVLRDDERNTFTELTALGQKIEAEKNGDTVLIRGSPVGRGDYDM